MLRSLRFKLTLTYIAVVAVAVLTAIVVMHFSVRSRFVGYVQGAQARQAQGLSERVGREYGRAHDWNGVRPLIDALGSMSRNAVLLVAPDGSLLMADAVGQEITVPPEVLQRALAGEMVQGVSGHNAEGEAIVHTALPIVDDGKPVAVLYLQLSSAFRKTPPFRQSFNASLNEALLASAVLASVLAVIFGAAFARGITRPIQEMRRVAERMAEGDYAQRVSNPGRDEVRQLAEAFNRMAATLERDVTELKRQEQIRREMVANISHDLSTPLTAIQGFSEALRDGVIREPEERHELLVTINKEALRLRRLVNDLQDLSQIESGRLRIEARPLNLGSLVEETLKVVQPELQERHLSVSSRVDPDLPPVLADEDRTAQALLNLLDNAARYTPQHGDVEVSAEHRDGMVRVTVRNSGDPIAPQDLPHIFERFYRGDKSRWNQTGSSGLGLAIVKAIVEAQGGQASAASEWRDGTRISFTLPVATPAAPAAEGLQSRKQVTV